MTKYVEAEMLIALFIIVKIWKQPSVHQQQSEKTAIIINGIIVMKNE